MRRNTLLTFLITIPGCDTSRPIEQTESSALAEVGASDIRCLMECGVGWFFPSDEDKCADDKPCVVNPDRACDGDYFGSRSYGICAPHSSYNKDRTLRSVSTGQFEGSRYCGLHYDIEISMYTPSWLTTTELSHWRVPADVVAQLNVAIESEVAALEEGEMGIKVFGSYMDRLFAPSALDRLDPPLSEASYNHCYAHLVSTLPLQCESQTVNGDALMPQSVCDGFGGEFASSPNPCMEGEVEADWRRCRCRGSGRHLQLADILMDPTTGQEFRCP
jgi:hypothetical protein